MKKLDKFITISQEKDDTELTEEQNKRLAEFVRICWHSGKYVSRYNVGRCLVCLRIYVSNPDFLTPDGLKLLTDKISENGEWDNFYEWYNKSCLFPNVYTAAIFFHETKDTKQKSSIVLLALQAGVIGEANEKLAPGESDPRD